jgi:hypothetical protein
MATGIKTGGRQKGTPNKTTAQMKETLSAFVFEQLEKIQDEDSQMWKELNVSQRIELLTKLIPYVLPKQQEATNEN